MEKNIMEKMQKKMLDLIGNGYGINQAMEHLNIEKKDVIKLMQEDEDFYKKLQKRFSGIDWIVKTEFKGTSVELTDGDTPELAALKAEAKELGVEFNPQIGYDKLKKRVDEFKAQQAEATQTPEA
jgi:hypothetical protein